MSRPTRRVPALLSLLVLAGVQAIGAQAPDQGVYAIEGVSVIPMDSEWTVLPDRTVVVRGGVIEAVGPAGQVRVPADATRIDGRGQWLLPGLAEMHAHVPPVQQPSSDQWPDREALEDILFLYVANGITTIRGMLGADYQLELERMLDAGEVVGPNLDVGAFSLNQNSARTPDDAERLIRMHAQKGYDFQKVHPGFSRETWDRAAAVAEEVGLPLAGHVPADVGLEHALATGIASVDHMDGFVDAVASEDVRRRVAAGEDVPLGEVVASATEARIREVARMTRDARVAVVPTAFLWENLYGNPNVDEMLSMPEMRYVSPQQRQAWRNQAAGRPSLTADVVEAHNELRRRILRVLEEEGVTILMGTDSPQLFNVPGFALHRELDVMRRSGLSNWEILETGTANVGAWIRQHLDEESSDVGTIAPGQRADLVLLERSPLVDLEHLTSRSGVMVNGRWYPRSVLDAGLERIAAKHAAG
ncbi:MAG: amidohydrolase family protein [Gemmatimonadetes bacterium]|nr:amidohydrolase family protein [Gemmatimonadota bacterium]